jgi:4-hydroxy-tetrahydrodipicolinate synthase
VRTISNPRRREFLQVLGTGAVGLVLSGGRASAQSRTSKPLRGIFPIAQTPFTEAGALDLDSLVAQVRFIDRGRVHGFVWPQLASEWSMLTEKERMDGAEAIMSAGKKLRPAMVLGVQGPTLESAIGYAKQAEKLGADAVISLPPANQSDPKAVLEYYRAVGGATGLPLFVQAVGSMSVEQVIEMYKAIPTLRYIKDEAGQPLARIAALRQMSGDQLKVFTGAHGRTLVDEMMRGFSGSMPAASFADIYAAAWDLWHEGKRREAVDMFGRASVLIGEISTYGMESMKYILVLRGVFKTSLTRERPRRGGGGGGASAAALATGSASTRSGFDDASKKVLADILELLKPHLRA